MTSRRESASGIEGITGLPEINRLVQSVLICTAGGGLLDAPRVQGGRLMGVVGGLNGGRPRMLEIRIIRL